MGEDGRIIKRHIKDIKSSRALEGSLQGRMGENTSVM